MWYNDLPVTRTHAKDGTQLAWAIVPGAGSGWLRIKPNSADGVTNIFMILSMALANNRKVDVYVQSGEITQATLR